MSDALHQRLNKVLPRVTSDDFLSSKGIGNEIAFYIFDYPPEYELQVRDYLRILTDHIPNKKPGLRFRHVNLFELVLDYLKGRNLLEKAIVKQRQEGDAALMKALVGPMHENKIRDVFKDVVRPHEQELVIVSGVGSVWPLLRAHTLLNNLHSVMGRTPLVMFYPGRYDEVSFRLFSKLKDKNYYRAFKLIP